MVAVRFGSNSTKICCFYCMIYYDLAVFLRARCIFESEYEYEYEYNHQKNTRIRVQVRVSQVLKKTSTSILEYKNEYKNEYNLVFQ